MKQPTNLDLALCDGLPWGQKVVAVNNDHNDDQDNYAEVYEKIDSINLSTNEIIVNGYEFGIDQIKPVLFDLSCLTKEITISDYNDGKPFVPIHELAKIHDEHLPELGSAKVQDWSEIMPALESFTYSWEYIIETTNMGSLVHEFSYWEKCNRFSLRDNTTRRPLSVSRQQEMFDLMDRFHFNRRNLKPDEFINAYNLNIY